ncbi:hypothetical protein L218DRAFT_1059191 [Marasmius fiardii PR-910]|nr:hypothetical protein L218DRAFT_1059191 [Marasmius fiardii PR-910]
MTDSSLYTTICNIPLANITTSQQPGFLNTPPAATPKHYRFLDCKSLVDDQHLHICETKDLSELSYSAVSYVWRGNVLDPTEQNENIFHVEGATDGDPISITVLQHVCTASIQQQCNYLWLDRLCIMQTSKEDKKWQIRNMYNIYKSCEVCLVLPAGLQHIVSLQTETPWIHRSWTLQESLVPSKVFVLFSWDKGPGVILAGEEEHDIIEVIPSQTGMATLSAIVNSCTVGNFKFLQHPANFNRSEGEKMDSQVLGQGTPNILALGAAFNDRLSAAPDSRYSAIWQCALMRTSSRPVDMVFSIMGMFDVSLDPGMFDKDDRVQATVALAQEILRKGGRASWLGISLDMPLSSEISTFPQFPETTVEGKATIQTLDGKREVGEIMEGCYPTSAGLEGPLPGGEMDQRGYLMLKCSSIGTIQPQSTLSQPQTHVQGSSVAEEILVKSFDGRIFSLEKPGVSISSGESEIFALIFGWFYKYYPGASLANDRNNIRGMLVQWHASNKYHVISYFSLDQKFRSWVMNLDTREFCIGGPNPPSSADA